LSSVIKEFILRLPDWIKIRASAGQHDTKQLLRRRGLTTVCEAARCPNIGGCFSKPTAAFMILGSKCTRHCGFCSVESSCPEAPDPEEPDKVADAAAEMGLRYVVITSVTRDDLPDGGAGHFAETIKSVRRRLPHARIEVLTPDFQGRLDDLKTVLNAGPDVFNHNIETVPRLYSLVRPFADYQRSLYLLANAREFAPRTHTKSGLMLGLGEKLEEIIGVFSDLRNAGCDFITVGQYLRPSKSNLAVVEYVTPDVFETLRLRAVSMGFKYAASAPLVRSSMNAEEMYNSI
jgi:lipoic acid synthetase